MIGRKKTSVGVSVSPEPHGRCITITPRNPTQTATMLAALTASFSKNTDRRVMNRGATKKSAVTCAKGMTATAA
ncbi:hypothetical protein [Thalassococcus halodurans]|uniref:hypothetical protein n=1 Tax=Thalassococcus halodurans TaxID=373675 RepID=UPI001F3B755A|nr:hypothetical protein [Thalassococcus halodurans]